MTNGGKLDADHVIHLDVEDMDTKAEWKKGISRCLEAAQKAELISLSFPALGTGKRIKYCIKLEKVFT